MTLEKNRTGEMELPSQFKEAYRPDLIKRAVLALQSAARQPYGASPEAGNRHVAKLSRRRRDYKTSYGIGISRVARKILSRRGTRMFWVGAMTPQTVGGRRAHPPKAGKILEERINIKERRKAIRSAIAATVSSELVKQRGHKIPPEYPFIIDAAIEDMKKAQDIEKLLVSLGFKEELLRSAQKKIRAGKGKMRGRKYQRKKGILMVVSQPCPLLHAAGNIPGMDVLPVNSLNAAVLAPGAMAGRVTLWTVKALEMMEDKKLFI